MLTKTDLATPEVIKTAQKTLKKLNPDIYEVTVLDDADVKKFGDMLVKMFAKSSK